MALAALAPASSGLAQEFEQRWQRPGPEIFPLAQSFGIDVATDPAGNMYLVRGHHQAPPFLDVAKLSPAGDLIDQWGPFDGAPGDFDPSSMPSVATDSTGEFVYFTDAGNCRVQRFRSDGTEPIAFGSCGAGPGQFSSPDAIRGLAVSPVTGDVYVGNLRDGVLRFSAGGEFLGSWGVPDFTGRRLHGVVALAVDPGGDVWAAIVDGFFITIAQVARFGPTGELLDLWPLAGETCPEGVSGSALNNLIGDIVVDRGGVYVINGNFARLEKYAHDGACAHAWGVPTGTVAGQAELRFATQMGLSLAPGGNVLVADDGILHEFTPSGAFVRALLGEGFPFGAVAVDAVRDTIYVGAAVGSPGPIRLYDLSGHQKGFWTDNGAVGGAAFAPPQLSVDGQGNLYAVQDFPRGGGRVRMFSPQGEHLRDFGRSCAFDCVGTPGELFHPLGVAVDDGGSVYVADFHLGFFPGGFAFTHRITKFDPSGLALFVWGSTGSGPGQFDTPFAGPFRLEIGPDGLLWVVDPGNRRIQIFDPDNGALVRTIGPRLDPAQPVLGEFGFGSPQSVGFREHPTLGPIAYVTDERNSRVWRLGLDGTFLGQALTKAAFDLDFDAGGDLYLLDRDAFGAPRLTRQRPLAVGAGEYLVLASTWIPPAALAGSPVEGFLFLVNMGSGVAEDFGVKQGLAPGDQFLGATPPGTFDPATSTVFWRLDPIPPGGTVLLRYRFQMAFRPLDTGIALFATVGTPSALVEADPDLGFLIPCVGGFAVLTGAIALSGGAVGVALAITTAGLGVPFVPVGTFLCVFGSGDPNEKGLPTRFARAGQPLFFPIHFENVGDAATRDIRVEDAMDPNLLDVISISPDGTFDVATRTLRWDLPGRILLPGDGDTVFFAATTPANLATGTVIRNQAGVFFDFNPVELTNVVEVTIDGEPPSSFVLPLPPTVPPSFDVCWNADDFGLSGVERVRLVAASDGQPFEIFAELRASSGCTTVAGQDGQTLCFFSQARDFLGNEEERRDVADTCTTVVANRPPVALCTDQVVAADVACLAQASVDAGSFDPDGDPILVEQDPPGPYPLGATSVTLVVADALARASCSATVTVVDQTPPVVDAGDDVGAECSSPAGTPVTLPSPTATDNCDPQPRVTLLASFDLYPLGETVVVVQATDASGNVGSDSLVVRVEDTTPPILRVSLSPTVLWPPNHMMVPIAATLDVEDACDAAPPTALVSASSSEPDDAPGGGDGHTTGDVQVASVFDIQLRAERSGAGAGRTYTLAFDALDASGNRTEASATVLVPHDQ